MKWVLVFFIGLVPETEEVDLYGFPGVPFSSQEECKLTVYNFYWELQAIVNRDHNTVGLEYPALCIKESDFYKLGGNPT